MLYEIEFSSNNFLKTMIFLDLRVFIVGLLKLDLFLMLRCTIVKLRYFQVCKEFCVHNFAFL